MPLFSVQDVSSEPKRYSNFIISQAFLSHFWLEEDSSTIQTKDILEILDDRYNKGSTILATQLPVSNWHSRFEDPTLADAIMDRVVHNSYRIELKGEPMRKKQKSLPAAGRLDSIRQLGHR